MALTFVRPGRRYPLRTQRARDRGPAANTYRHKAASPGAIWLALLAPLLLALSACSTVPPGAHFPKPPSHVQLAPQDTRLGMHFQGAVAAHGGNLSGFRVISIGVDGFLARVEMINAAERNLDLQYYIFRNDESGTLIRDALTRAAQRGVHVRILVDDADTHPGDERIFALANLPNIEIRVYNPWRYRGHLKLLRNLEFATHKSRLDYRMHNKLLVVDEAVALVGGRNIGDQYFQIDPQSQFADDDVFCVGPVVPDLEQRFEDFWNSELAIPSAALETPPPPGHEPHGNSKGHPTDEELRKAGSRYSEKLATGEPLAGILSGQTELYWATAQVVCDSPNKKDVVKGQRAGRLIYKPLADAISAAQRELLITTPYFIPDKDEMNLLHEVRAREARVAILTNSLQSAPEISAHAGYMHYRVPLLREGVELYEVRSKIDSTRGSGQSKRISDYGNYALHGKILVFDRKRVYLGSMNFDRRSRYLNTEIGLVIDSAEISRQMGARFDAMTQLDSAYMVVPHPQPDGHSIRLSWRTRENGQILEYSKEPARSWWQRFKIRLLSLLPLDSEL
jgi:cardiolipin synthase C